VLKTEGRIRCSDEERALGRLGDAYKAASHPNGLVIWTFSVSRRHGSHSWDFGRLRISLSADELDVWAETGGQAKEFGRRMTAKVTYLRLFLIQTVCRARCGASLWRIISIALNNRYPLSISHQIVLVGQPAKAGEGRPSYVICETKQMQRSAYGKEAI
jgi:hypothetical protein